MAVYQGAANLLIPRGTVGSPTAQPRIKPTIIILHTNAGNTSLAGAAQLMATTTKGQEYHFQQEASGTGRVAGRLGQYVDTTIRADNNYKANSFAVGGVLCGAISIETADHGAPYELSWTDLGQRKNLEDLVVWLCQTHNIPARQCPDPYSPGIGYHSLWGLNTTSNPNINPWTNTIGKICPGPGKIREYPDLLASVARRVNGGGDSIPQKEADVGFYVKDGTAEWMVDGGQQFKRRLGINAAANDFGESINVLAGGLTIVVNSGTATEQANKRAWLASIPDQDITADDSPMAAIKASADTAANNARAAAEIAAETKELVEALPSGGGGGTTPESYAITLTGRATPE